MVYYNQGSDERLNMNITINNDYKTAFGTKYVVLGDKNKSVPFLYNKVVDTILVITE